MLLSLLTFIHFNSTCNFSRVYQLLFPCISSTAKNCVELYHSGQRISGVYTVDPDGSGAFNVFCDQTTSGGGVDSLPEEDKLDWINRLTQNKTKNMLRVDLGVTTRQTVHAEYEWFGIGNGKTDYRLYIGNMTSK